MNKIKCWFGFHFWGPEWSDLKTEMKMTNSNGDTAIMYRLWHTCQRCKKDRPVPA